MPSADFDNEVQVVTGKYFIAPQLAKELLHQGAVIVARPENPMIARTLFKHDRLVAFAPGTKPGRAMPCAMSMADYGERR